MKHMQEDDFDRIQRTNWEQPCKHEIVKLYQCGCHTDYGCIKCGMKSLVIENFEVKSE